MPLAVSRMCKSRFAEHSPLIQLYPQLRRKAACSGFRIEVYLRHTPCTLTIELSEVQKLNELKTSFAKPKEASLSLVVGSYGQWFLGTETTIFAWNGAEANR